jgi:rRNA-processing protein FCF1
MLHSPAYGVYMYPCFFLSQKFFVVLDTNVLMDHIAYIEDLRDQTFGNLGKPVVVIPWIVMQELDSLKDNKGQKMVRISS